jgi:sec-independent protein translocase protein TatA
MTDMTDMSDMIDVTSTLLAFGLPGPTEWIVLLVLGLLIFGRRLPEVGRSLGRGIVEFKRGIKGIEDDIEDESSQSKSGRYGDAPAPRKLETPSDAQPREQARSSIPEARVGGGDNPYVASTGERDRPRDVV